jgi:integrase
MVGSDVIVISPAESVSAPKRERNGRTYLIPEEYTRLLSLAGSSPRDCAILQVFLQTGIRVSELCSLTLSDVDLADRTVTIRQGKPGNLLPFKNQYQEIANGLPKGGILIVLPHVLPYELAFRRAFEQTAAQLKQKGKRITTISAERFVRLIRAPLLLPSVS